MGHDFDSGNHTIVWRLQIEITPEPQKPTECFFAFDTPACWSERFTYYGVPRSEATATEASGSQPLPLNTTAPNLVTASPGMPTTMRLGLGIGLGLALLVLLFTVTGCVVRRKRHSESSKRGATADRNTGTVQEMDATRILAGFSREKNTRAVELSSATKPVELMGGQRQPPIELPI